jgi:hypothetical protein
MGFLLLCTLFSPRFFFLRSLNWSSDPKTLVMVDHGRRIAINRTGARFPFTLPEYAYYEHTAIAPSSVHIAFRWV